MNMKQHISMGLFGVIRCRSAALSIARHCFSVYQSVSITGLPRIGLMVAVTAALSLSACVESTVPLLTDARPLLGERFEVHLYENFVDGKAGDFHTSAYQWKDGEYLGNRGLARDAKRFVAEPLEANDFLLQSTDSTNHFNYWIGRKLAGGVYWIFSLDETDADDATRAAACEKDQPEGICRVSSHDELLRMARATAAKPVRDAALGVVLIR